MRLNGSPVAPGIFVLYLSIIVMLPLAALVARANGLGLHALWRIVTAPGSMASLELSLGSAIAVACMNAFFGTLIAWTLVRDSFPGKAVVNAVIDLPFALPTIVAGLILLALYGPASPFLINVAYTRTAVVLALLFVTLPFVVRSVQPVILALESEQEEAAQSLGADPWTTFRRIILPALTPAIVSGAALSFARAVGEFGSLVLISGNIPFKTEVASVHIFGQIESGDLPGAAANSLFLLLLSFVVLFGVKALPWMRRNA